MPELPRESRRDGSGGLGQSRAAVINMAVYRIVEHGLSIDGLDKRTTQNEAERRDLQSHERGWQAKVRSGRGTPPMSDESTPPHNLEAERAVLGACMMKAAAVDVATALIDAADFWRDAHARIWRAILTVQSQGAAVDLLTVRDALATSGDLESVGGPAVRGNTHRRSTAVDERRALRAHRTADIASSTRAVSGRAWCTRKPRRCC